MKLLYTVENLDCPHCAAKIENAIRQMDGIEDASLSYAAGLLQVTAAVEEGLLERIQAVSDSIEDGVVFSKKHSHSPAQAHDGSHAHAHEHDHAEEKGERLTLGIGALLFVAGIVLLFLHTGIAAKLVLLAAYLVLGAGVLLDSLRSIGKGQLFDENFLMTIATVGALCIGCWEEAAGVMLFFRIGELFEHLAVERSRKSVMDAIDLRPETVQRLRDGSETPETIPAAQVQPGDLLLVRAGDRIPVDGILRKGSGAVDTSAMTGESQPVQVQPGDSVMSGCVNLSGVLELEATAALKDSMVQRILDSVENAAAGKPKLDRFITRFSRIYTPVVVAAALLTAVVPPLFTGEWSHWIYTALNFLMISCPCALVLSVPLSYFAGIGAGSAKGILFKDGMSLEALARVKAVVMDKTGTLTQGSFSVTDICTDGDPAQVLRYAAACESGSVHPIAVSILRCAQERGLSTSPAQDITEMAGKGILGMAEGKRIACGNEKLMAEQNILLPENVPAGIHVAADGAYLGTLLLSDALKPGAAETVQAMQRRGLYTVMLTGDSPAHAAPVAEALHVAETHAGLLPTEKPTYMESVRAAHGSVLFVGDGINDAPVLSGADVGAAMGSGADAAMEAADVVLLGSDPQSILTALQLAGLVDRTAKICIALALIVKGLILLLGLLGFANMWLSVFADTGVTILCVCIVLLRIRLRKRVK